MTINDIIATFKDRFNDFGFVLKTNVCSVACEVYCSSVFVGDIVFYNNYLVSYYYKGECDIIRYIDLDIDVIVGLYLCKAYYG